VPPQKTGAQPAQTGRVASPNPTVDDSKTRPSDASKQVEATPVQPAETTTGAPMKTGKSKKSKHHKTKPSGE
jgi:hypothetical protein